ncbi:MAG: hypothetical protein AB7O59_19130 [Pirellulales bacterium]
MVAISDDSLELRSQIGQMALACDLLPSSQAGDVRQVQSHFTRRGAAVDTILIAAAEYSLLYMLLGGGFFGAILVYFVARAMGR